jgi:molybdopterin biosynthesis enzyme MoaB
MIISNALGVRIMGLGSAGGRALPAVVRAVGDLWSGAGAVAVESACVGDDARLASRVIRRWCDREKVDVVLTVGRAGHGSEDFAPELTAALLDRALPGIEERMYLDSARGPRDVLFRGKAGMRRGTLVVNLPDRPARARAIVRLLGPVIAHAVEKARGSDRECACAGAPP